MGCKSQESGKSEIFVLIIIGYYLVPLQERTTVLIPIMWLIFSQGKIQHKVPYNA